MPRMHLRILGSFWGDGLLPANRVWWRSTIAAAHCAGESLGSDRIVTQMACPGGMDTILILRRATGRSAGAWYSGISSGTTSDPTGRAGFTMRKMARNMKAD